VGWNSDPAFEPSAIHAIYLATGGIPRRVNAMCNRLMLAGFLAGQHAFTAAEVKHVAAEITGELGPQPVNVPLRDLPLANGPVSADVGAARNLQRVTDRLEKIERDLSELLSLVRFAVVPERVSRLNGEASRRRRRRRA
jgi:hypothetical protein